MSKDNNKDSVSKTEDTNLKPEASSEKKAEAKASPETSTANTEKETPKAGSKEANTEKETPKAGSEKETSSDTSASSKDPEDSDLKLDSLFAFKLGMTHIYDDKNRMIPVTALKYKALKVTQIKTKECDGYEAVQLALESAKKTNKARTNHVKKAQLKGSSILKEVRQSLPQGLSLGQSLSINSLKAGDIVSLTGVSKGHGFSGVMKRWSFGGGRASHGTEKHRTTGSIANTATQGRVFPGKKLPGHFGCDRTTVKNSKVIHMDSNEGIIFVKGPVPGAIRSLVQIKKQQVTK